jgi:hypothetical protein
MRITVQHALKVPAEEEYSSRQHSVAMELDVPADIVAQGKDAIREYVAKVTTEVRSYVEEALNSARVEAQEREPAPRPEAPARSPGPSTRSAPHGRTAPRTPPAGGPARRAPVHSRAGRMNGNGNGEGASLKQVNYLRSLASQAGYSDGQLGHLAQEVVGHGDLNALTKREASQLIDQLRAGE